MACIVRDVNQVPLSFDSNEKDIVIVIDFVALVVAELVRGEEIEVVVHLRHPHAHNGVDFGEVAFGPVDTVVPADALVVLDVTLVEVDHYLLPVLFDKEADLVINGRNRVELVKAVPVLLLVQLEE